METVSGESNWNLTVRREADHITLLRCVTCDERAVLPGELRGLPVTALGDHALSPDAREVEGETVRITHGRGGDGADWNNARLRELTLPPSLRRVGDYALFNCRALQTLRLSDSVSFWGGAVLMNCRELNAVQILRERDGDNGAMAYFAGELNRELDISVLQAGTVSLRLIFPAYRENYEENSPAHHFDYVIEGAGYPYHHCFHQRKLDMREYDNLWGDPKTREMDPDTALRLAWWRLRYPEGLSQAARARYLSFLQTHTGEAALWLLGERDTAGLSFLIRHTEPDRETLSAALSLARERGLTEAVAILLEVLEKRRKRFAVTDAGRFAL